MTETTSRPEVATDQVFVAHAHWIRQLERQVTTLLVEKAGRAALDLAYYVINQLKCAENGDQCRVTLDAFLVHQRCMDGYDEPTCKEAWDTFDWSAAITEPHPTPLAS